jgi:hypothetical protein
MVGSWHDTIAILVQMEYLMLAIFLWKLNTEMTTLDFDKAGYCQSGGGKDVFGDG